MANLETKLPQILTHEAVCVSSMAGFTDSARANANGLHTGVDSF